MSAMTSPSSASTERVDVSPLLARVRRTRASLRFVGLLRFLVRAVLLLAAAAILSFLIDREWEPQLGVRLPIMCLIVAVAVIGALAELVNRMRRSQLSDDQVAKLIEDANPWLQEGFLSAIQLAREIESGSGIESKALMAALVKKTVGGRGSYRSAREARLFPIFPALLSAGLIAGLIAGAFQYEPTQAYARAWRDRVILLSAEARYPKPVEISEVEVPEEHRGTKPESLFVVRGEDLPITIYVLRGLPAEMVVVTEFPSARNLERKRLARIAEAEKRTIGFGEHAREVTVQEVYKKVFENVTEPFRFKIEAGYGVETRVYEVKLIERARIEEARFWLQFPEYTNLPATPKEKPLTRTSLEAPVGTVLRYEVRATLPVDSASLQVFADADAELKNPSEGPKPQVAGDAELKGRLLVGELPIGQSLRFRFQLLNAEGVVGDKAAVVYQVKALADEPPTVTFKEPGRSKSVTKKASVPMLIAVRDQYGIEHVELHTTHKRAGVTLKRDVFPLRDYEGNEQKADYKTSLLIYDLNVQEGDQIEYRAEAFDRNIDESKRIGRSLAYTLTIVSDDDFSRQMQDRVRRLKDDLEGAVKAQDLAKKEAEKARDEMAAKNSIDREDQRRLSRIESLQHNVTKRLSQVREELGNIQRERSVNQIRDEQEEALQRSLEDTAKDLAEQQSPAVERDLRDLISQPETLDRNKLARVPDKQERIQQAVQGLVDKLDKWGDISDVLRDLDDIEKVQGRVHDATGEILRDQNK
jgi:hypothetical protein